VEILQQEDERPARSQRGEIGAHSGKEYRLARCAATASATAEQPRGTALGYRTVRCRACRRKFNKRTGTAANHVQYPIDLVLLVVLRRRRYKLSLRDLAEMFLDRGFVFTHEAVRDWEARFAPLLSERLRTRRRGAAGAKRHADETYVRVNGTW
jgi:hypothetical protein